MPGLTLMTATEPLPPVSSARLRAASRPPSSLSEAISDSASSAPFSVVVSTNTSLIPAALAWVRGGIMAWVSVGATRIASGFLATTALTTGVCWAASNSSGAATSRVAPAAWAASRAPHSMVT